MSCIWMLYLPHFSNVFHIYHIYLSDSIISCMWIIVVYRDPKQQRNRDIWYKMKMNNCEAKWVMENRIFRLCMAFCDWGLYCYGVLFRRCCAFLCSCLLCDEYQMKWWWLDVVIHAFANGYKIMIIIKMCMYHLVPYR